MSKQDGSSRRTSSTHADDAQATILHIDMDAFFASVELLDYPELVGKPVIIGHRSGRSVVTSATYEARKYGVNSAMPMALALRRCPQAIVLEPHMERYRYFSGRVMEIFGDATPLVEPLSIDEAFLDVSGARSLLGSPRRIGEHIRQRVHTETGLTCSVGAASTKFVAKLASGQAKPDGLLVIPDSEVVSFLHPLPVNALWGVGERTEQTLLRYGLRTVADLAGAPVGMLTKILGEALGRRLHDLSWGIDSRTVSAETKEKSIGHEVTFEHDVTDATVIRLEILAQADRVAGRLRSAGLNARTVALKLRYGDFSTVTRSITLPEPTDVGRRIYDEAIGLYRGLHAGGKRIRLVGVRVEQLVEVQAAVGGSGQLALWETEDPDIDWRAAEKTIDSLRAKFGSTSIGPASLVGRKARAQGGTRRTLLAHEQGSNDQPPPQNEREE